jgi:hypothetical protein
MLNINLKDNEPSSCDLRSDQSHKAVENQYMLMRVPQIHQQIQNRSIDRLLITVWPLHHSVSLIHELSAAAAGLWHVTRILVGVLKLQLTKLNDS